MRRFTFGDMDAINAWHRARGLPAKTMELVPPSGYIEPDVAAGFVYLTNSRIALLDGFISNPAAPSSRRGAALASVADRLVAEFQDRHFLVYTAHPAIMAWALGRGMQHLGTHSLFGKVA